MRRPLLLLGSGGAARDVIELVRAVNDASRRWMLAGLLDDDVSLVGTKVGGVPVLGALRCAADWTEAAVVIAGVPSADAPEARLLVADRLALDDDRYATLIHPTAVVARSATVGPGSLVHAHAVLTAGVFLANHVAVLPSVVLANDVVVGAGATIAAGARLAEEVEVGPGAFVGAGAHVREGRRVGAGAVVGMGSVVTHDVPDHEVWAGIPARPFWTGARRPVAGLVG